MFKITVISVFFVSLVPIHSLLAQHTTQRGEFSTFIPSPEAASLGEFGEVPVSLYSGVPNISINLFNLEFNDGFTLPISLRYDASGIRVDQIASSVGLGWSLQAGGVITKTVHGASDITHGRLMPDSPTSFDPTYSSASGADNTDYHDAADIVAGNKDIEPDEFFFNFAGRSGKFVFPFAQFGTITAATIPFERLSITASSGSSEEVFQIIDESGVLYEFKEIESTSISTSCQGGSFSPGQFTPIPVNVTRSWYLSKIVTTNNEEIQFTYQDFSYSYSQSGFEQTYFKKSWNPLECPNNIGDRYCDRTTIVTGKHISEINVPSRNIKIQFVYDSVQREDLPNTKRIASAKFLIGSTVADEYVFSHSYFRSGQYSSSDDAETIALDSRLRLDSILRLNDQQWVFDYESSITMPRRQSFQQDHWGYFNNKLNSTLIPSESGLNFVGANRESNPSSVGVGMLKMITWPTGGSTGFTYEINRAEHPIESGYLNYGGVRVQKIEIADGMGGLEEQFFEYDESQVVNPYKGGYRDEISFHDFDSNFNLIECTYDVLTAAPVQPLGGSVRQTGYGTVWQLFGDNGQFGKITHKFSRSISDMTNGAVGGGTAEVAMFNWAGGHPTETIHEQNQGSGVFVPVRQKIYNYEVYHTPGNYLGSDFPDKHDKNIWAWRVEQKRPEMTDPISHAFFPALYDVTNYKHVSVWFHPDYEIERIYNNNGIEFIETRKEYKYENTLNIQPTQITELLTGTTEKRTTEFTYAHEEWSDMGGEKMYRPVYSTTIKDESGNVLQKRWTIWGNSDGFWRPRCEIEWDGTSDPETLAPNSCQ